MRLSTLLCALTLIPLTACSNPATGLKAAQNPNPTNGYIITLDASAAPGEIVNPNARVSFDATWSGSPCMPKSPPIVEWRMPWQYVEVPLKKVAPNTYEGVVYTDWLKDEQYFKKGGLCAWKMNMVNSGFAGQGGLGFGVGLSYLDLKDGATSTMYYLVEDFTAPASENTFGSAYSVPTNDFKDLENSYVNDTSKYFPVYVRARVLPGAPGLMSNDEFNQRVRRENPQGDHIDTK